MAGKPLPIDLTARDPQNINAGLQVIFEDVLAEPDETHSMDCVWLKAYSCFTCGKNCCYKFMTTLCGICIGLYWGCEFAMITFNMVWCCTPSLKVCTIVTDLGQQFNRLCIHCCLAPFCEAVGMLFNKITITEVSGGGGQKKIVNNKKPFKKTK